MGMTIDEAIKHAEEVGNGCNECAVEHRQLAEWLRKYQQLQADYENRLKADMVAMLTEIQLEIEEYRLNFVGTGEESIQGFADGLAKGVSFIYQKINALKGGSND